MEVETEMIITYANGETIEGFILTCNDRVMRVALKGSDDVAEFASVNDAWISEDGEPVQVWYEWQRQVRKPVVSEADCVCSKDLAARLIHLLFSGGEQGKLRIGSPVEDSQHFSLSQLVA